MKATIIISSLLLAMLSSFAYNAVAKEPQNEAAILAEIEKNISLTQKRMQLAQERTQALEKAVDAAQDNVLKIQKEIHRKMGVQERSSQLITEYKGRLQEATTARDDFIAALEKDRKELALVRKDILVAKKKLGALQAAEEALKESIEISEESLEKISGRSKKWSDNRGTAAGDLKDVAQELIVLEKQKKEQEVNLEQNQASLKKWRKSYVELSDSLQKLTLRLKAIQRGKTKN